MNLLQFTNTPKGVSINIARRDCLLSKKHEHYSPQTLRRVFLSWGAPHSHRKGRGPFYGMNMKTCRLCKSNKPSDDYYAHPTSSDGLMSACKDCVKTERKARYDRLRAEEQDAPSPDLVKMCNACKVKKPLSDFYKQIGGKMGTYSTCAQCQRDAKAKERADSVERFKSYEREMYQKHRHKKLLARRKYYSKNREEILAKVADYYKKRYKSDLNFRLRRNLSRRINLAVKSGTGRESTAVLLGCSVDQFVEHIEKQFRTGMSWDNYGYWGWHLDHKKPCAAFDLTKKADRAKCFHYTNYQPLWRFENAQKGGKWEEVSA